MHFTKFSAAQLLLAAALCIAPAAARAYEEQPEGEGLDCGNVYVDLECKGGSASVELEASAFIYSGASVTWSSTCRGGEFTDISILNPTFSLNAENDKGAPQSCQVLLFVDYGYGYSQTCSAPVSVSPCARDCAGTIDGNAKLDQCGVCNGDGTSCLDCTGTFGGNATVDRCGVCNGDGSSCLDCATTDTLPALLKLDGSTLGQKNLILSATRLLVELSPTKATIALAEKTNALAQNYYQQSWTQIYSLPTQVLTCGNTNFCTSASTAGYVATFNANSDKLTELLSRTIRLVKKYSDRPGIGKRLLEKSADLTRIADETIAGLPTSQSSCS